MLLHPRFQIGRIWILDRDKGNYLRERVFAWSLALLNQARECTHHKARYGDIPQDRNDDWIVRRMRTHSSELPWKGCRPPACPREARKWGLAKTG